MHRDEAQFIQKIVEDISLKLHSNHFGIDENLVGMQTRGTDATRSIKLQNTNLSPYTIMNGVRMMKEIRLIHIDDKFVDKSNARSPDALRYIYWRKYQLCCLPITFQATNLVKLQMAGGNINDIWEGNIRKVK
ncbi:hypothetical protein E3N88_09374 [Mikania micrantha]|uniref:Uncharacterized protein n=1 Tax=Mikania micrantha TaxID=192012 RepID=A0A5N6PJS4_9ASTR|nr:hypothetical protein E3N88_09374 [Mikania micrantha]